MAGLDLNILDFSGAFSEEGLGQAVAGSMSGINVRTIDCKDIEGTNCYCEDEAQEEILRRFTHALAADASDEGRMQLSWIDTGDYHHLSKMTVSEAARRCGKLTVIQIDHHPDMQEPAFGGILSCGGWLRSLLEECLEVEKAFVVGISPELAGECGGFADRVTVFDKEAVRQDAEGEGPGIVDRICEAVRGRKVFFSIDKDVLGREWSRTDWDHGTMSLEYLCQAVRRVAAVSEIVGVDICGGITSAKGGSGEDYAVNLRTDLRILELIQKELRY